MHTVVLGTAGPEVSAVGLGCMGMSELYGPADRAESLAVLGRAVELGATFLDTSDTYGVGHNEQLLGDFLRSASSLRDRVVLATKFGVVRDPRTGAPLAVRGDAAYVREACEASLRRLGTDHIDLYYQHFSDPGTPIEETVGAMADLVAAGKVRHLGLSNISAERLRAACRVHPIAAVQSEWSLFSREAEDLLVPVCAELGVGFVPYAPLGRGFLTCRYTSTEGLAPDDFRQAVSRFDSENSAHNTALLEPVLRIAETHGATPAQVALAWLIDQTSVRGLTVVPIPGTKHVARLEENAGAARIRLTGDDRAALEPLAGRVGGSGVPAVRPEIARMFGVA